MDWRLHDLGFLPLRDPVARLDRAALQDVERLGKDLPQLNHDQSFRVASRTYLAAAIDWDAVLPALAEAEVERLFMLYSYFASAYVHAPGLGPVNLLPEYLAAPLVRLAQRVERPPILSYASYCLHNWARLEPGRPVALGNLRLLQNFSLPGKGKEDEDWFILVHVDIEARAGQALQALNRGKSILLEEDAAALVAILEATSSSLEQMNKTLARMPEGCSPEVYFRKVRPYIFGFTDIVYEGCFDGAPQTYRGETGAQSSIIPTMLVALGLRHKSSLLTQHLEDMRNYMPPPHRRFIREQMSLREPVQRLASESGPQGRRLKELYNDCVREVIAFRSKHFEYAVNYIEKKVADPIATGGTPYIPWLRQLIEETREYLIP